MNARTEQAAAPLRQGLAIAAATAPSLLAYNVSPSPTFLNQALALALWGGFVIAAAPGSGRASRGAGPLLAALALLLAAVLWSWGPGALPMGLALSATGLLLAAAVLVASGAGAHARPDAAQAFGDFCLAWVVAGVLNVGIAAVQVFAPGWTDGDWIATSGIPGRAVGNLRQPNHLSSLLLWSAIAVVALLELRRLSRGWAVALFAAMVFAVVLTASRTGTVSVLLLALWGLADRRLARPTRALLLAAPVVYAVAWFGMAEWAQLTQATFGGAARLAESDVSGSRFGIWANTLALIRQHPWGGVGFGEFNFAWSLTAFPGRPTAFFDHTHNLPLQLAVELGLPLAALVLGLLLWALARAALAAWRARRRRHRRHRHWPPLRHGDGGDDRPAQPAGVPALVQLLPAARGLGLGLRAGPVRRHRRARRQRAGPQLRWPRARRWCWARCWRWPTTAASRPSSAPAPCRWPSASPTASAACSSPTTPTTPRPPPRPRTHPPTCSPSSAPRTTCWTRG